MVQRPSRVDSFLTLFAAFAAGVSLALVLVNLVGCG